MNLTLYFRLILLSIFQRKVVQTNESISGHLTYQTQSFTCPRVYAKDGFNVSLQIDCNHNCTSENGNQMLGHTMIEVEVGFPSHSDPILDQYGNCDRVPVKVLESVFEARGGIDWEKTISQEAFESLVT